MKAAWAKLLALAEAAKATVRALSEAEANCAPSTTLEEALFALVNAAAAKDDAEADAATAASLLV